MTEHQFSAINAVENSAEPAADLWRHEVQARIAGYKKRRGRRVEGAFSMRFPFPAEEVVEPVEPAEAMPVVAEAALEASTRIPEEDLVPGPPVRFFEVRDLLQNDSTDVVAEQIAETENGAPGVVELVLEPLPEPEPEPYIDTVPRPRPKRKVIAFPRHLSAAPETAYRLADPVISESPRILDVPEELEAIPTTPFLDGLQLDQVNPADASRDREHVELPFRAVRVSQRVFAGIIDVTVTGVGVAVFAAVALKVLAKPPLTKPLILGLVVAAGLLWSVYQYLFVVYAGRTLGMMAAKICLRTFKGKAPNLRQRRHRVLGFYLSALSLGMGLMWMFVDVDSLCWHDRLSQTYLTDRQP
ncbi:MAG TPA: RDD family protein [Terriglobales bacterium]